MSLNKHDEKYEIGQNIRERRIALGLSQDDLAEKGISLPPTVLTDTQLAEALCPLF